MSMRTRSTSRPARVRRAAALACATAVVAAGALACGEPTAPVSEADLLGTYVLRSVANRPMPYVINSQSGSALFGSRIILMSGGQYQSLDSLGIIGQPTRTAWPGTGTWQLEQRSGGRQFVRIRPNNRGNGAPSEVTSEYAVRDRGQTLEFTTTDANGGPEQWIHRREP